MMDILKPISVQPDRSTLLIKPTSNSSIRCKRRRPLDEYGNNSTQRETSRCKTSNADVASSIYSSHVISIVAQFLSYSDITTLACTCQSWRAALLQKNELWKHIQLPVGTKMDDATMEKLLHRCAYKPASIDLRGCCGVLSSSLMRLSKCESLQSLDLRGLTIKANIPALLLSLSPFITTNSEAGKDFVQTLIPYKRQLGARIGSCSQAWHGVIRNIAEWNQLMETICSAPCDATTCESAKTTSATAPLPSPPAIDFEDNMLIFISREGQFKGSFWPKPIPQIACVVIQEGVDTRIVVKVNIPRIGNSGWLDLVCVKKSEHNVMWYFDHQDNWSDSVHCFQPRESLPTALTTKWLQPVEVQLNNETQSSRKLDVFLQWIASKNLTSTTTRRSARSLQRSNSTTGKNTEAVKYSKNLPNSIRVDIVRELQFHNFLATGLKSSLSSWIKDCEIPKVTRKNGLEKNKRNCSLLDAVAISKNTHEAGVSPPFSHCKSVHFEEIEMSLDTPSPPDQHHHEHMVQTKPKQQITPPWTPCESDDEEQEGTKYAGIRDEKPPLMQDLSENATATDTASILLTAKEPQQYCNSVYVHRKLQEYKKESNYKISDRESSPLQQSHNTEGLFPVGTDDSIAPDTNLKGIGSRTPLSTEQGIINESALTNELNVSQKIPVYAKNRMCTKIHAADLLSLLGLPPKAHMVSETRHDEDTFSVLASTTNHVDYKSLMSFKGKFYLENCSINQSSGSKCEKDVYAEETQEMSHPKDPLMDVGAEPVSIPSCNNLDENSIGQEDKLCFETHEIKSRNHMNISDDELRAYCRKRQLVSRCPNDELKRRLRRRLLIGLQLGLFEFKQAKRLETSTFKDTELSTVVVIG